MNTENRKPCARCNGTGRLEAFEPGGADRACVWCRGNGTFPTLTSQYSRVVDLLRGKKPGLRKSRPVQAPNGCDFDTKIAHDRAYYVWRLARFHGGLDMHLPIVAELGSSADPDLKLLDAMADDVAEKFLGTKHAAALRWGRALGGV